MIRWRRSARHRRRVLQQQTHRSRHLWCAHDNLAAVTMRDYVTMCTTSSIHIYVYAQTCPMPSFELFLTLKKIKKTSTTTHTCAYCLLYIFENYDSNHIITLRGEWKKTTNNWQKDHHIWDKYKKTKRNTHICYEQERYLCWSSTKLIYYDKKI